MSISNQHEKRTCPCKLLPLSLSSLTGAEFGNVHSLLRHDAASIRRKRDSAGNTPLHLAAQHGHVAATSVLLAAGCDVNANASSGATPLHRASFSGAVATMRLLLSSSTTSSQQQQQQYECDLMAKDTSFGDHMTALHKAASGGRYLAVQLLLSAHAQRGTLRPALEARDANDETALQVARRKIAIQAQERQSVARWDVVAGGRADWSICAQLLEQAGRDDDENGNGNATIPSVEDIVAQSNKINGTRNSNGGGLPFQGLPVPMRNSENSNNVVVKDDEQDDDCLDCETGECVTKAWESAFQMGLMQAVRQRQETSSTTRTRTATATTTPNDGNDSGSVDAWPVETQIASQRDHNKRNNIARNNHDVKDGDDAPLGRPCSICSKQSLFLYPVSGSLVCRSCKKKGKPG